MASLDGDIVGLFDCCFTYACLLSLPCVQLFRSFYYQSVVFIVKQLIFSGSLQTICLADAQAA